MRSISGRVICGKPAHAQPLSLIMASLEKPAPNGKLYLIRKAKKSLPSHWVLPMVGYRTAAERPRG
jgi:hypothetical protein